MAPSFGGCNDLVRVCRPFEGFGVFVGLGDEAIDGGLVVWNSGVDQVQKAGEYLVTAALDIAPDRRPVEHVQGS